MKGAEKHNPDGGIYYFVKSTFIYLFVSFAPVISASIHRYGNYFDIQVLMMVTETETLTSTLHHDIFTYLDYDFLFPSYCRILSIFTFIYIYIGQSIWVYEFTKLTLVWHKDSSMVDQTHPDSHSLQ